MTLDRLDRILEIISFSILPMFKGTIYFTIPLSIVSFALGLFFAFFVAFASLSTKSYLHKPARIYVWIIRCTPVLVQLFIIFYGLPSIGIILSPFLSVVISLTISEAAYTSEIIRASIQSIPTGQWRAGYALGMSRSQTLTKVILPQSIRVCIPSFGNQFISLFKTSSLAALVTIPDLFGAARLIASSTFEPMLLYLIAGSFYLVLCSLLTIGQSRMEKKFIHIKS
ncbi:amino acid ABC transporter permease [Paenibacillus sp. Soil724D2]|uniref:amino acid ABC transporter permease n=1 Tax=Paenibacillus sp. (strain Soil724D2) TaxID=1736392 RepID=UPI0007158B5F|nr:amino acid ABC transporter permease [Paenibacillus sp. Soil724D2]KRE36538.1 cysteine ABC transporter permease [Paenibacillus sp. Soil724D2]